MRLKMNREAMTLVQILAAFVFVSLSGLTMVTVSLADDGTGTQPQLAQTTGVSNQPPGVPAIGGQPPAAAAAPVPNPSSLPPSLPPAGPLRSVESPPVPAAQALSTNTPVRAEVRRPSDKPVIYETNDGSGRKFTYAPGTIIAPPPRGVERQFFLLPKLAGYKVSMIWDGYTIHHIVYEPIAEGEEGFLPPDKRATIGRDGTITYPDGKTYNPGTGVISFPRPRR